MCGHSERYSDGTSCYIHSSINRTVQLNRPSSFSTSIREVAKLLISLPVYWNSQPKMITLQPGYCTSSIE